VPWSAAGMRVAVIGGTRFIGRRLVEQLAERGDEVLVVHRGQSEPADLVPCAHLHAERRDFASVAGEVAGFGPDAVVDTMALSRDDVTAVLPYLPDVPVIALSSMDVYRSFGALLDEDATPLPVPVDEDGPVRANRYPYRGKGMRADDYDKLDVEPAYLARGGTVLRLAMIYGPHDEQRREEFVLRRVRAGRPRIPIGPRRRCSRGCTSTTRRAPSSPPSTGRQRPPARCSTTAVARSVRWHLAHPPDGAATDFAADDAALRGSQS
jgi:nucleoside-diphosphate-sugar epimerase